jgi:hypothetical protein
MVSPFEIGEDISQMELDDESMQGAVEADSLLRPATNNGTVRLPSSFRSGLLGSLGCRVAVVLFVVAVVSLAIQSTTTRQRYDETRFPEPKTVVVELEGKHKKHHDVTDDSSSDDQLQHESTCTDGHYSKHTLKRAYELPFAALFRDHKSQRKYEASSVIVVDGSAYAVCDSSWAISKFDVHLTPFSSENIQVGRVDRENDDSGYEALFQEEGIFYVVRESIQHDDEKYHAVIEELDLEESDYSIVNQCSTEYTFEGDSKGFEGAITIRDLNNEMIILGLCEGNHCSETHKNESGNGRLIAMRKTVDNRPNGKSHCTWTTIRMINIPSSANFKDYSGMTMNDSGKVGISSQENSQFWVGQLLGKDNNSGRWDINEVEFDMSIGKVYDFPKNDNCETIYCNIEGVHWLNDDMIIAVSDKMKGRGKQDFICHDKDQSVHVFVLPE